MHRFRNLVLAGFAVGGLLCSLFNLHAQTDDPERGKIPTGPSVIAGTVVDANNGHPLAHARVTIMDAKQRQNVQVTSTTDAGRFEFHVPAGKFALQGARRGYITSAYNQHEQFSTAIVTGVPGVDSENLKLRLPPNAVLAGKVLDEFGEPVRQAQVQVYRESRETGMSRISRFNGAVTDDLGRYEVTPLDAGTYFVSVKATPWYAVHPTSARDGASAPIQVDNALDVAYPVTYYGDTTEADTATPIPIRGGDHLEADIHLNPTPALHLIFHAGENGAPAAYPQMQRSVFDGVEEVESGSVEAVSPGVFEMTGVPAGRYLLRMPDSNGQLKEPTATDLTSSQELDGASGNATGSVTVKAAMEGGGAIPAQAWIGLRDAKGILVAALVNAKGEANFADVIPGKYDVVAGSRTETYKVTRIAWENGSAPGRAVSGRTVNVASGASLSVTASLLVGSVQIEGLAKQDGKASAGAMVVLIPQDPENNVDRFRRDQSDLDGTFTLLNVNPGSYTVIAIEDGWDLDWAKLAVLAHYGKNGQPLVITTNERGTVHLPEPVPIAAK